MLHEIRENYMAYNERDSSYGERQYIILLGWFESNSLSFYTHNKHSILWKYKILGGCIMKGKTQVKIIKTMAIAQAVIAPGLIVAGTISNNNVIKNIGIIWCGLVTLDTAKTSIVAINLAYNGTAGYKQFISDSED